MMYADLYIPMELFGRRINAQLSSQIRVLGINRGVAKGFDARRCGQLP